MLILFTNIKRLACLSHQWHPLLTNRTQAGDKDFEALVGGHQPSIFPCMQVNPPWKTNMDHLKISGDKDGCTPFTYVYYHTVENCVQPWDSWGL